jgi:hypothetical protein
VSTVCERDTGGTEPAKEHTPFYGKGIKNHELGIDFLYVMGYISAAKRVERVNNGTLYIILISRCIVPNVSFPNRS